MKDRTKACWYVDPGFSKCEEQPRYPTCIACTSRLWTPDSTGTYFSYCKHRGLNEERRVDIYCDLNLPEHRKSPSWCPRRESKKHPANDITCCSECKHSLEYTDKSRCVCDHPEARSRTDVCIDAYLERGNRHRPWWCPHDAKNDLDQIALTLGLVRKPNEPDTKFRQRIYKVIK